MRTAVTRILARLLTRIAPSRPPEPSRLDLWDGLGTPRDDVMARILAESRARSVRHSDISDEGGE